MKRLMAMILLLAVCISIAACGSNNGDVVQPTTGSQSTNPPASEGPTEAAPTEEPQVDVAVEAVINAIDKIGFVDENSGDAIKLAEELYLALTPQQKQKVFNYETLEKARKEFAALPVTVALTVENFEEYFSIENSVTTADVYEPKNYVTYYRSLMDIVTTIKSKVQLESMDNVSVTIRFIVTREFNDEVAQIEEEQIVTVSISAITGMGESVKNIKVTRAESGGGNYSHKFFDLELESYVIENVTGTVGTKR